MNAHRVDIFHVADRDAGTGAVPHHFVLDFFPPKQRSLDKDLMNRARVQPTRGDALQFGPRSGDPPARATEGVRRSNDQWQRHLFSKLQRLADRGDDRALDNGLAQFEQQAAKEFAVLSLLDRRERRSQEANAVSIQGSPLGDLNGEIQPGLTAESRQQAVRAFSLDDTADHVWRQRLDVDRVRHPLVRHDGRGVRVHQDGAYAFFPQRAAGLRPRVVEFGSLTNDDRARPEHEDTANV